MPADELHAMMASCVLTYQAQPKTLLLLLQALVQAPADLYCLLLASEHAACPLVAAVERSKPPAVQAVYTVLHGFAAWQHLDCQLAHWHLYVLLPPAHQLLLLLLVALQDYAVPAGLHHAVAMQCLGSS